MSRFQGTAAGDGTLSTSSTPMVTELGGWAGRLHEQLLALSAVGWGVNFLIRF